MVGRHPIFLKLEKNVGRIVPIALKWSHCHSYGNGHITWSKLIIKTQACKKISQVAIQDGIVTQLPTKFTDKRGTKARAVLH
jgi:hypothetical protein